MAANIAAIRAGRASVELFADDSDLARGLESAEAKIKAFGTGVTAAGRTMLLWGGAIAAPLAHAVKEWMDAEAELRRFGAIFNEQAGAAGAWADDFGKSIGRSRIEVRDLMGQFMEVWLMMGYGRKEAAALSEQMTKAAYDFASFNNIADPEAVVLFTRALAGNTRGLMRYGINLKEGALEQELLREGLVGGTDAANEAQKGYARMQIILADLKNQHAEGAAGQDTFANSLKRFRSVADDTWRVIGKQLMPALQGWMELAGRMLLSFQKWSTLNGQVFVGLMHVAGALIALGTAGLVIGGIAKSVAGLTIAVNVCRKAWVALRSAMIAMQVAGRVIPAIPVGAGAGAGAVGIAGEVGGAAAGVAAAGGSAALTGASAATLTTVGVSSAAAATGVGLLVLALTAVGWAASKAADNVAKVTEVTTKEYDAAKAAVQGNGALLARLDELAMQGKLTAAEQTEAKGIIDTLTAAYGDYGISVNESTGFVEGLGDAHVALTKAMKESLQVMVGGALDKVNEGLAENQQKLDALTGNWVQFGMMVQGVSSLWVKGGASAAQIRQQAVDALEAQQAALLAKRAELTKVGTVPSGVPEKPKAVLTKAQKRAEEDAEYALHMLRITNRDTEHGDALATIADERDKRLDGLALEYEKKMAHARKAGATEKTLADMKATWDEENRKAVSDAEEKTNKHYAEIGKKDIERKRTIQELELEMSLKGTALAHAKLALEEKRAMAAAKAAGENLDAVRREFALRNQLLDLRKFSVRGTFSGEATWGMTTGSEGQQMIGLLNKIERNTNTSANKRAAFG